MPRILIAECKQEISSFNPVICTYDSFTVNTGQSLFAYHNNIETEVSGALSVFSQRPDMELIPAYGARATSAGPLSHESFERIASEFLQAVQKNAQGIDACYFSMHGAMGTTKELDPEGYLLQETRKIIGPKIPIVLSLDLHGILTARMLQHTNGLALYHTYPHVDFADTGARAAKLLLRILDDHAHPVVARVRMPVLVRGNELITETGAIRSCIDLAKEIEASPAGLSAGVMWGNPFTDVPELCTSSVVVMDGDEAAARRHALELASRFWARHEAMQVPLTSLEESVRLAAGVSGGTVVLMDAADATSSGASGDSNAILRELVRQGYSGRALAPIVDPGAVRQAFAAGVGGRIHTTLGGACDPTRFQPLALEARVRLLSDGQFRSETFGWPWDAGDTAVLEAGNLTVVVGSRPVSLFDRSWFYANGQDPRHFDLVVVKSPHCERHMFADWCARLIDVDAPGSTSANLRRLGHTQCTRPLFPLDEGVTFQPQVQIFRRS